MSVTKISIYEQVGTGNFAGETDVEQHNAANNFSRILTEKMTEYCTENYPDADLDIKFNVENVSGCCQEFTVHVENEENELMRDIEKELRNEYDAICHNLEQSGEIYE